MKHYTEISKGLDSEGTFWTVTVETDDEVRHYGKFRDKFDAWDKANEIDKQ